MSKVILILTIATECQETSTHTAQIKEKMNFKLPFLILGIITDTMIFKVNFF